MRFMIADTFSKSLGSLSPQEQNLVKQAAFDFQLNPAQPGAQLHRLERARDKHLWSFRVDRDVRVIVYKSRDDLVLLYADHHDRAYRWAENRQFVPNPETGAMQLVEVHERVEEVVRRVVRETVAESPLFAQHEPSYLLALGVPERWLDAVRLVGETGFLALLDHLPGEAGENLMSLADGQPVPRPLVTSGDPFLHPDAQRRFRVLESDGDLARALAAPWETWLVFLHPSQEAAAGKTYSGPAKLAGGAGTGKTVVALHRAARLGGRPGARVLLTTFSRTLAARLGEQLRLLGSPHPTSSVQVEHLHRLAARLWGTHAGKPFRPLADDDLNARLERLSSGDLTPAFLRAEWDEVVAPHGVRTWEAYKSVPRAGRGVPLGLRQRKAVWDALGPLRRDLEAEGLLSFEELCLRLTDLLTRTGEHPFDHVVADEVQDFGPAELRLLRALAPAGPDDLFLAGDLGQRIYKAGSSFLAAGIHVRGRSSVLRLNYRTTEQIRRYADALLPDRLRTDDGDDETRHTVSLLSGPAPETLAFTRPHEETQRLAERLTHLLKIGFGPGDIAVFTRTRAALEHRVVPALELCGLTGVQLSDDRPPERGHVALGTMHRAKGLEFRAVFVVGCEADQLPLAATLRTLGDAAARAAFAERERNLFYVACTRAREQLLLTYVGTPSPLLGGVGRV